MFLQKQKNSLAEMDIFSFLGLSGIALIHLGPESHEPFKFALPFWSFILNATFLFFFFTCSASARIIMGSKKIRVHHVFKSLITFYFCYSILIVMDLIVGNRFIWGNPLEIESLLKQLLFQGNDIFTNGYVLARVLAISIVLFFIKLISNIFKFPSLKSLYYINATLVILYGLHPQFLTEYEFSIIATAVFIYMFQQMSLYESFERNVLLNVTFSASIVALALGNSFAFGVFIFLTLLSLIFVAVKLKNYSNFALESNVTIYTLFSFYVLNYNLGEAIKNQIKYRLGASDGLWIICLSIVFVWLYSLIFGYIFNRLVLLISRIPPRELKVKP